MKLALRIIASFPVRRARQALRVGKFLLDGEYCSVYTGLR